MSTVQRFSDEPLQITLEHLLGRQYNGRGYELTPIAGNYQQGGNARWKIDVSNANNMPRITLYCQRNSTSDNYLAVYYVRLISHGVIVCPGAECHSPYGVLDGTNYNCSNGYASTICQTTSQLDKYHHQGHARFSGPTSITSIKIDLTNQNNILPCMQLVTLQLHITISKYIAPSLVEQQQQTENCVSVFDDIFSFAEKAQLFSSSSPYPSDCVIILKDDKEVHVQKSLLSLHSEYFNELFAKDNSDRILLDTLDYNEFVELCSVIYPSGHPISARNVESLSKLASEFKMPDMLKRCDIFLMENSTKFGRSKLLLMAQDYNLKFLQAHYTNKFKSVSDVKAIKNEPEYASLNCQTRRMILDNIIKTNSTSSAPVSSAPEKNETTMNTTAKQAREAVILETLSSSTMCPPNILLVVGHKQIRAHKEYLSVYSQYFNAMFQNGFKENRENEIVLEEIDYDEILELLTVVYPSEHSITESNIGTILKLADRFIMPVILTRCKKVLNSTSTIRGALKLWYAQQYNFTNLQEEFARQYKTIADVLKIKAQPEFELLDDNTRALLLDSITR